MASLFTKIIDGDLPARFVYTDDICVAFLTIEPLSPGHTLVVPRAEIDHWLNLDDATLGHLMDVARRVGRAIEAVYQPRKVGLMIAGLEVPHVHIHVTQVNSLHDLDFANVNRTPDLTEMDKAMASLTDALER